MDSMELLNNARIMQGWQVEGLLGRGRHSTVWAIRRGDEDAALKVIRVTPEEGEVASCQRRGLTELGLAKLYQIKLQKCGKEVRIMRILQGESNFVSYQDHEVLQAADGYGGTILVRMERLTSLRSYVNEHGVSQANVVELARSIARALDICHCGRKCAKFVHGDVKIDNIYYSRDGVFKLGDFGLSSSTDGDTSFSGTLGYIAPEAAQTGKQPTGDIYALGMTMYILLNQMETPVREGENELPRPANCVSDELWQVILCMTSYVPEQRYQSMQQVLKALATIDVSVPEMQLVSPLTDGERVDVDCTLTDTMARHTLLREPVIQLPNADAERSSPAEAGEKLSAISQELETIFRQETQNARIKRRQILRTVGCVVVLLLLTGLGLCGLLSNILQNPKEVSMTAVIDQQGMLIVEVADNTDGHLLWVHCGGDLAQQLMPYSVKDQESISFNELSAPNAQMLLQIGEDCSLKISNLPPDVNCEVSLLDVEIGKIIRNVVVSTPAASEAEISGRVHTLWYCLKTDIEVWLDKEENPYIALRRAEILLRAKSDLVLPAATRSTEDQVWFMNVTFDGNVDAAAQYTLLLRCGDEVVVSCPLTASQVYWLDDNRLTLFLPDALVQSGIGRSGETFTLQLLLDGKEAYTYSGEYEISARN